MQNSTKTFAITLLLTACFFLSKAQTTVTDTSASSLSATKELQTVTVISKKQFIEMSAGKMVVNVGQSAVAVASNAYDIIKKAAGVSAQGGDLSYKGKSTKILINGRGVNVSGDDLKTLLTTVQGSTVEKIELISTPSSKYDAEGGAVINIILKKNKAFGTNYILSTSIGTGKNISASAGMDVNHRAKDINIYGGYNFAHTLRYSNTNTVRSLANGKINSIDHDEKNRNNNSYKIGVDYDISKRSSAGFLLNGFINDRDRNASNYSTLHNNNIATDSISKVFTQGNARISGPLLNVYFKTKLDTTGKELVLNVDHMNYRKTWNDQFINNYFDSKGNEYQQPDLLNNNSPADIKVYAFSADYTQPLKKGKLEAGIKSTYTITDNDALWQANNGSGWVTDITKTNHFIYKEYVNAGYINYSRPIKKWALQLGLRGELTNTTGNSITMAQIDKKQYFNIFPTIDVQFNKNDNNQFGFNYRKSIRRYGLSYVNPFVVYQSQYAVSKGNPQIQPELTDNFELSYTFKQAYSLSLNYSHGKRTLGEIYLQGPANTTISSYGNYKSSDIVYASLSVYQPITKWWIASINPMIGYMTLNNTSALASATKNDNMLITQINWMNELNFKKDWSAEFSVMYISPFQYGSYKTKTFITADMGVTKSILRKKATINLSIEDIFNSLVYNKEVNYAGVSAAIDQKEESRFINLSFKYKFGNSNVKGKAQRSSKVGDIQSRIN